MSRIFGSIMHLLTSLRFSLPRAPRLVAAIFAIGWLGFAVAPCGAMPNHQHPGTSHHGSMPADDCGHCQNAPSGAGSGCAVVAAPECMSMGPAIPGFRDAQSSHPSLGPPLEPSIFAAFIPDAGPVRKSDARHLPVANVSLQQRYCTYLK